MLGAVAFVVAFMVGVALAIGGITFAFLVYRLFDEVVAEVFTLITVSIIGIILVALTLVNSPFTIVLK